MFLTTLSRRYLLLLAEDRERGVRSAFTPLLLTGPARPSTVFELLFLLRLELSLLSSTKPSRSNRATAYGDCQLLPSQVELEEVQPDRYRWLEESSIEVTVDIPKLSEYRHSHLFALLCHTAMPEQYIVPT